MLEFQRSVKSDDEKAVVSVFIDSEKGHTVYVSHTGAIVVAESEKKGGKIRAAGFSMASGDCSSCDGC